MSASMLRKTNSQSLNFTGRFDLKAVSYTLTLATDGRLGFRVALGETKALRKRLGDVSQTVVILRFRSPHNYGEQPVRRFTFAELLAGEGVLTGGLPAVAQPGELGLEVVVKNALNPEGADRIAAFASRNRPSAVEEADECVTVEEAPPRKQALRPARVRLVQPTEAPEGSLVHFRVDPNVSGAFKVALVDSDHTALQMPTLLIHPNYGTRRLQNDKALQALMFPEVIRRVITAMALHARYQDAPWYDAWRRFAASLSPAGDEFEYFTDGERPGDPDLDPELVNDRVEAAVAKYAALMGLKVVADPSWDEEG